jgi:hypothetical protein
MIIYVALEVQIHGLRLKSNEEMEELRKKIDHAVRGLFQINLTASAETDRMTLDFDDDIEVNITEHAGEPENNNNIKEQRMSSGDIKPQNLPTIVTEIELLEEVVHQLDAVTIEIVKKVEPILRPESPKEGIPSNAKDVLKVSAVANMICTQRIKVMTLIDILCDVRRRIEL